MTGIEQQRWPILYRALAIASASLIGWSPVIAWWFL